MSDPDSEDALLGSPFYLALGILPVQALSVWRVRVFAIVICVIGFALLIYSCIYVRSPGPHSIYNHFPSILMSLCLIFQCVQIFLVARSWMVKSSRFKIICRWIYWGVIVLTTFISGIGWAVSMKQDTAAIQFLAFFLGLTGLMLLSWNQAVAHQQSAVASRWYVKLGRGSNRFLKLIHAVLCILFTSGAITLALQSQYSYPGTRHFITLTTGQTLSLNIYCTGPPSSSTPTIWFESSQAHGITDFLGLQTYLLNDHGRYSCSYDHISQGLSDTAPKGYTNSSVYWSPMLSALGRQNEPYIGVGWGGGGEGVLSHALESPATTEGVVLLDTSPDGIEWMDEARENNWNEAQLLEFRQLDLAGRVSLTQIILTLCISWGLLPLFIPNNGTGYFDQSIYPAHRAQSLKDDIWAFQYYFLVELIKTPNIDTYLTDTVLPPSIPVYSIITNNSNTASDIFQIGKKVDLVEHVAGGKDQVKGMAWCTHPDCDLGFPVDMSKWTADQLISLGI